MPEENFKLVNAYEELVMENVRKIMDETDMCRCEKCFLDICAIVFNQRYTHFVTTKQGETLAKVPDMGHGNRVEMLVTIMNAINLVRSFPKH